LCRKLEYVLHHLETRDKILSPEARVQFKTSKTATLMEELDYPSVFENFIMKNRSDLFFLIHHINKGILYMTFYCRPFLSVMNESYVFTSQSCTKRTKFTEDYPVVHCDDVSLDPHN
jgi:hypothetical protein